MSRRAQKWGPRLFLAAPPLAAAALLTRLLAGCSDGAPASSTFGSPEDAGDEATAVVVPPLLSDGGSTDPVPVSPPGVLAAGPPVVPPICNPSVARESCEPPESTYVLPATITVTSDGDAGCRQAIHAEPRDGGAFACVIGTSTSCYGPLTLGTSYPFTLGHSSSAGDVTATFTVRFEGDGGVPATVTVGGCFN